MPESALGVARDSDHARAARYQRIYWQWRNTVAQNLRRVATHGRLARLRLLARNSRRYCPGSVCVGGLRISYDDALSLYMEYKHIFGWGIYDFRPAGATPRVLDCGGHLGLSTLRFKQLAPNCRVTVFEPDERVLPLLHRNISENRLRGVEIVPAGLAPKQGCASFVADGADGGALARDGYAPPGALSVPTVPLSDYLDEPVDFLKMNIEGMELDVLREAASKLHRVRQLVVEYHGFPQLGQGLHALLALLHECGFRYAVHHFDYETNPALRPPFRMHETTRFFQLIAATRLWEPRRQASGAFASQTRADSHAVSAESRCGAASQPQPVSRVFGFDRGQPIDRHYIESFLAANSADIRGRVLEVGDALYTQRFGKERVTKSDILHVRPHANATIVADLTNCPQIADGVFDCFILTQTLPFIFDAQSALRNAWRILRPGGVLLLTVPGISQRSAYDAQRWGDYWRFTPLSVQRMLAARFPESAIAIRAFGNVRTATALLEGRAAHEVSSAELDFADDDYPVIIAARARRPSSATGAA